MEKNNKQESIIKGVAQYSVSTWANLVIGFVSVVLTTRILAPDEYGMVSIFLSATNFLMYVVTFGMDGAYIRFYNSPPINNTRNQVLYKMFILSTILSCVLGIISVFFFYKEVSMYIFGIQSRIMVGMVFLYVICQAVLRYLNINFRMGFKVKQYTIQNIMISCLARILIIVSALLTEGINYIVCTVGIGTAVAMIIYLVIQRREFIPYADDGKINFSISLKNYGEFLRFSLFSAPTYFVTYFNSFLSQQIVRSSLGAHKLGVFTACGMFSTIFSALKGGFATYWSAYVYKNYETQKEKIRKMHNYVLIFAILSASFLVIMRDLVFIVIGKEFHESKQFFSILLLMPVLNLVLETTDKGIALAKKSEIILITHIVSVITNIVGCIMLIPVLGIIGAAFAEGASAVVLYVLNTYFGQKYYKSIESTGKSVLGIGIILVLMICPVIFTESKWIICFTLFIDILACIFFKKECIFIVGYLGNYIKKVKK